MQKDFDSWNIEKKRLQETGREDFIFRERDIWWCSIGINIGTEEDGKNDLFERPVLIIRKFNSKMVWGVPVTSRNRISPYHFMLEHGENRNSAILSQMRTISIKRFKRFVRRISTYEFAMIMGKTIDILRYR